MKARRLGSTDLVVSEIGLGCQSLGGGLHHGGTRRALALVARALDLGITYFDTSDHYSLGASEALLGRGLRGVRDRVVLATKAGTYYTPAARAALRVRPLAQPLRRFLRPLKLSLDRTRSTQRRADFSAGYLRAAVESSLRRLQTDYLDVLQLHKPPPEILRSGEIVATVETLRRDGKVRHFGISCETADDALLCLSLPHLAALQVTVNLLEAPAVDASLHEAASRGLGIIARNPRAAGLLTESHGDITGETYAADRAAFSASQQQAALFEFLVTTERTLAQAAIQFVLQRDGVSTTIPRALDIPQLEEAVMAAQLPPLTAAELERVDALRATFVDPNRKYAYRSKFVGRVG